MTDSKHEKPDLTIVGGQPHGKRRRQFRGKIQVPVGLEKAIFHAARDEEFKARLLEDPRAAIEGSGINLRASELAMLAAVPSAALEDMIDRVVPENPKNRKFMGLVANAAASLAAGTVLSGCPDEAETENPDHNQDGGAGPDIGTTSWDSDGGTATDTSTGTPTTSTSTSATAGTSTATATSSDTVSTDNPDTEGAGGVAPDTSSDTDSTTS
jgi:hypothetical protein